MSVGFECIANFVTQGMEIDGRLLTAGDLVPATLAEAGVSEVFHKVEMKPGKPIWFGVRESPSNSACYVFGLPGNPVSSLVCCELFVRTAIHRMISAQDSSDHIRGSRPWGCPLSHSPWRHSVAESTDHFRTAVRATAATATTG